MKQKGLTKSNIGDEDGIFWMKLEDFMVHFDELNVCRFFDEQWTKLTYRSEWSEALGTNGGCGNFESFPNNPQLAFNVEANEPIDVYI